MGERRLVVDTDAGLDDAQAIIMALAAPKVKIEAITTVAGNTTVADVTRNVMRLLSTTGHLEVPVYKGCTKGLLGFEKPEDYCYHGQDGLGDVPDPNPADLSLVKPLHAVNALIELAQSHPGELTLVALGPLTNVAVALKLWPNLASSFKDCIIMGGNSQGQGNITHCAEFNFFADPEAAHIVLNEMRCPVTMVTWELCLENPVSWGTYDKLFSKDTAVCKLLRKADENTLATVYGGRSDSAPYLMADQLAMAVAVTTPGLVLDAKPLRVIVETAGNHTRGQTVIDRQKGATPNVSMVMKIDMERVLQLLEAGLSMGQH